MATYEICSGKIYDDKHALIAIGYSGGNKGLEPGAVNNPYMVDVPNVGPIPPGVYTILPPEDDPVTGIYSMPLVPSPENEMHNRSGFRIHGDNPKLDKSASDGCVILPHSIRMEIWDSGDRTLDVVAQIPEDF